MVTRKRAIIGWSDKIWHFYKIFTTSITFNLFSISNGTDFTHIIRYLRISVEPNNIAVNKLLESEISLILPSKM